jgi:hypothetical protein
MRLIFAVFLFFVMNAAQAASTDVCEILNLSNCSGIHKMGRRSSAQSVPSTATAAQFNPANVSHDRGFGVETMYQPGQSPSFSFVTGTGKTGAALVSSKIENGFFGNRVIELHQDYLDRREDEDQFQSEKQSLALGGALWKNKSFSFDVGVLLKYNPDIERVNPGAGTSIRWGIFNLGASYYQDDVKLKFRDLINPNSGLTYALEYGDDEYEERFNVQSYFAGVKIVNLFLDAGVIKTHHKFYQDDTTIRIYSAAFIWRNFLFNLAVRQEESPNWRYTQNTLVDERKKNETYGGIQYSFNQHLIMGVHHNYYLLREMAASLTLFI